MTEPSCVITFEPIGLRVMAGPGRTLLEAARDAGIRMTSVCGGLGTCGKCRVQVIKGEVTAPRGDTAHITDTEWAQGVRLACLSIPRGDAVTVYIPPESLELRQQLQVECQFVRSAPDNDLQLVRLNPPAPTLSDLRDDVSRICDHLKSVLYRDITIPHALMKTLSNTVRAAGWDATAVVLRGRLTALLPANRKPFGLAVDMGTTKVAAYLVDLQEGRVVDSEGAMNGQAAYGEDVVSRIACANESRGNAERLRAVLCDTVNQLVQTLSERHGLIPEQWVDAVLVGNTVIHHLFAGFPVRQLGMAPYIPAVTEPITLEAENTGLSIHPAARVYLPSNLAGYIGCDHVAALTAEQIYDSDETVMLCDIGTNTEITLRHNGKMSCCSCASGPAFEGAHIKFGMRAACGAIDHVVIQQGRVTCTTIDQDQPVGLCGSGVLDAVAQSLAVGALSEAGGLIAGHPLVEAFGNERAVCLNRDAPVFLAQSDVSVIQLAKGAIRVGIDILLEDAGIQPHDVKRFILAGAFGTYIDPESALTIGMFPPWPSAVIHQVGNAAGRGAVHLLLSDSMKQRARTIRDHMHYVELTTYPKFSRKLAQAMLFRP